MATIDGIYAHTLRLKLNDEQTRREYDSSSSETTIYTVKGKTLIFIGGSHVRGRAPFIGFIEKAFKRFDPDVVLVEQSMDMPGHRMRDKLKRPEREWTEVEWLVNLADKRKIEFRGMDAASNWMFGSFLEMGDKDGIKAGLLRWTISEYKHLLSMELGLSKEDLYDMVVMSIAMDFVRPGRFSEFNIEFIALRKRYHRLSLNNFMKKVIQGATDKYIEKAPFLSVVEKPGIDSPYPWGRGYKMNKVRAWWNAYRNKSMIDECIKALKQHDTVLAMAGWGHIFTIRELLAKEIIKNVGPVEVLRWKDYAKSA
ncbi:Uncharacterised protein [uncultured archaeon]|nr:Uncharacterised protein [uncultured archaeon]